MCDQDRQRRLARALPADDVVGAILEQHADIADLLEQLDNSAGEQRRASFGALDLLLRARESARRQLAAAIDGAGTEGDRGPDRTLALLDRMSGLDVDSLRFSDLSDELVAQVSADLAEEETTDLPALGRLPEHERGRLGAVFARAVAAASDSPDVQPSVGL